MSLRIRSTLGVEDQLVAQGVRLEVTAEDVAVTIWVGPHPGDPARNLLMVRGETEVIPPREVLSVLDEIVRRHEAGERDYGRAIVDIESFAEFTAQVGRRLRDSCRAAFECLRWSSDADSRHDPYSGLGTEFSRHPGDEWWGLPGRGSVVSWMSAGVPLTYSAAARVQALLDVGAVEPLGHHLLREARGVWMTNPRSAVVIAVAAIETGLKRLIAELVPDTRWLLESLQSPDVVKMLRLYMPSLPARLRFNGEVYRPPRYAITTIRKAIEDRNDIAHARPGESLNGKELLDTLDTIGDTLYLFDYYAGHQWAGTLISTRFMDALRSEGTAVDQR